MLPSPAVLHTCPSAFIACVHREDRAGLRREILAALKDDRPIDGSFRIVRPEVPARLGGAPQRLRQVLMDMQMPVMDGLHATAAIRAWECESGTPHLPILALTANAMSQDVQNCLAAGCDGHLAKPIKKHTLIAAIATALQGVPA